MTNSGNRPYTVVYHAAVLKHDLPALPQAARQQLKRAIEQRLMLDPVGFGKPLRYSLKGHRRLRVGDYRIVYRIDAPANVVTVVAMKHRKAVYEGF